MICIIFKIKFIQNTVKNKANCMLLVNFQIHKTDNKYVL